MKTSMKLNVQHLNIRSNHRLDTWVEEQILALGRTRQIEEATVRLMRHPEGSPSCQVNVHLVTPGPDLFVESRDHTLRAAFEKAMEQLRGQVTHRAEKRLRRIKSNLNAPRPRVAV